MPYVYQDQGGAWVRATRVHRRGGRRAADSDRCPGRVDALPGVGGAPAARRGTNAASWRRARRSARPNAARIRTRTRTARVSRSGRRRRPPPVGNPGEGPRGVRRGGRRRRRRIGRGRGTHARGGRGWKTKTGEATLARRRRRVRVGVRATPPASRVAALAPILARRRVGPDTCSAVLRRAGLASSTPTGRTRGGGGGGDARAMSAGDALRGSRDDPVKVRGSGTGRAMEHPAQGSDDQKRGVGGEEQTPREFG